MHHPMSINFRYLFIMRSFLFSAALRKVTRSLKDDSFMLFIFIIKSSVYLKRDTNVSINTGLISDEIYRIEKFLSLYMT